MSVLEPRELAESPLADLHLIAAELGIEGYRRLSRDDLVAAIVESQGGTVPADAPEEAPEAPEEETGDDKPAPARGRGRGRRRAKAPEPEAEPEPEPEPEREPEPEEGRSGFLDVLHNGSGFLRSAAYSQARDDVYVSPAQIRRCELRPGDEVEGPVRPPRRSERHPSLVHVEKVNGADAEPPAERPEFADLTPVYPAERLAAPEGLESAPFGKGSRVAIGGPPGAGATMLLRRIVAGLAERDPELELTVTLVGVRPEELAEWRAGPADVVGGSFDEPLDRQVEAATMAVERAKRAAERGRDAAVAIDSLDALQPAAARRIFGAGRNTEEAGSVTVLATTGLAAEPVRVATTRIVLEASAVPAGEAGAPKLSAEASGALRADLLGAEA